MRWWALAADAVLVAVFAAVGMLQHHGGFEAAGLAEVAWPFLVGLAIGWAATLAWRAPTRLVRTGLPLWAITLAGGMLLRWATGGGVAVPFVIVAAVTLAVFLIGWRAIARLVVHLRARRS